MKLRTILILVTLTFTSSLHLHVSAQTGDFPIEIQTGSKYLNVDSLKLAPTTILVELLEMFPELLAREGDAKLENYDLQINDVSTGDSKQIILYQLVLSDIKTIEVSQNPSASQQKNGQGGVINVKLKNPEEGFSGRMIVEAGSLATFVPAVRLNYRKGGWTVRGSVMMNYYHPQNENSLTGTLSDNVYTYKRDTSAIDYGYEMASVDAFFNPDGRNELHLWAWENLSLYSDVSDSDIEVNSMKTQESSVLKQRNFSYLVGANYNHKFDKSKIEAECTFAGAPNTYVYDKYDSGSRRGDDFLSYYDDGADTKLTSLAKYTYNFIPDTPRKKSSLTGGVNCNLNTNALDYSFVKAAKDVKLHGAVTTLYLAPYLETKNIFEKWYLKASVRYKHYSSDTDVNSMGNFSKKEDYFTGYLSAGYQIAPRHHLSLILDRSVERGSAQQLYPYAIFDPSKGGFTSGNPHLLPMKINSVSVNYITNFKAGKSEFTFDAELKYMNNTDLISEVIYDNDADGINDITYENSGYSNIGAANLLLGFSRDVFSLSLTANAFENFTHISDVDDNYFYYNISAVPNLNFREGWVISARLTYNSHVYTKTSRLGDYIFAMTRFSKTWDRFTAYLQIADNFHKFAEDYFYGESLEKSLWYNLHRPSLDIGFHMTF